MTVPRGKWLWIVAGTLIVVGGGLETGCDDHKQAMAPPPPPAVTAAHPLERDVTQWDEFTGRLEAVDTVEVIARVSGLVETVNFADGAVVKKGDLLFTIDPRMFQAELETAQAAVVQAEAKLEVAKSDLARTERVAKSGTGSVSTDELETKRGTVKESEGAVAEAKAKVDAAQLNVDWCKVTALISGRISDKRVSAGNMITGGGGQAAGTVLTTIKSVDPIYCNLDADEASVLKYQKQVQDKRSDPAQEPVLPCYMGLRNEVGFPHVGKIDFLDNRVNEATSTRRARGVFDNSDGRMLPGYFARIRLAGEILPHAILVIDDVVGTDQNRKYLYVLHADNTIEQRTVTVGPLMGELRVIQGGLSPDELVIVNGLSSLMMVRPGGKVNPTITEMPEHRLAAAVAAHNAVQDSDAAGKSGSAGQTQPASHGEGGR